MEMEKVVYRKDKKTLSVEMTGEEVSFLSEGTNLMLSIFAVIYKEFSDQKQVESKRFLK